MRSWAAAAVVVGLSGLGATAAAAPQLPLGSSWKYDDRGVDLGDGWRDPAYDDGAWPSGPAQLGYGDGDEATLLAQRSPTQPTVYFRRTVELSADASAATLTVIHDDGAAVWVNGVPVLSRLVGSTAYSAWATGASAENQRTTVTIPASVLHAGTNVVAAIVKQAYPSSSDVTFDLSLEATLVPGPVTPTLRVLAPNGAEQLVAGSTAQLSWATTGSIPTVDLAVSTDGGATFATLATALINGGSFPWTVPAQATTQGLFRVADSSLPSRFDASDAPFSIALPVASEGIALGSDWRYDDSGRDPGATWATPGFDDSGWASGRAELGYGDGDEATVLRRLSPMQPSLYFRKELLLDGPPAQADLTVIFDDGVAVFVNGTPAFSRYVAGGTAFGTFASATSADNEQATTSLPPGLFVAGRNVIAAVVKQAGSTSSDVSFDLALAFGAAAPPPPPPPPGGSLGVQVVHTDTTHEFFAVDRDGTAYAISKTSSTQLLASTDGARSWSARGRHPLGASFRYLTALADGTLLANSQRNGLYYLSRSGDHGVTWTDVLTAGSYRMLTAHSVAELDGTVFFLEYQTFTGQATPIRLWASTDGARSFQLRFTFQGHRHGHGLAADPTHHNLWAMFGDTTPQSGTYLSRDGGASWTLMVSGQPGDVVDATVLPDGALLFGQDISALPPPPAIARVDLDGTYTELQRTPGPAYSTYGIRGGGFVVGVSREPNGDIYAPGEVSAHVLVSADGVSFDDVLQYPRDLATDTARADVYWELPGGELVLELRNVQGFGTRGLGYQILRQLR